MARMDLAGSQDPITVGLVAFFWGLVAFFCKFAWFARNQGGGFQGRGVNPPTAGDSWCTWAFSGTRNR